MTLFRRCLLASLTLPALFCSCQTQDKTRPLTPNVFTTPRAQKDIQSDPLSSADQPGALQQGAHNDAPDLSRPRSEPPVQAISRTVQENVQLPGARAADDLAEPPTTALATSRPTTTPGASTGQYLTLGGIVMDVNGTPIFADEVLNIVEPALADRAKSLGPQQFRTFAERQIVKVVEDLRDLQLGYAAAERSLDQKDKDLADALTMQWRQRQISAAGGSEEVARRRFAERGQDFDELVQQQYRNWMRRIYFDKRLMPRVEPSANEIRAYYDQNVAREFSQPDSARFRLIKIDPAKLEGDREKALRTITELRNRIVKAGESFEAIARTVNHDPRWLASGGDLGAAIQRGAFAIEPVEKAVWETLQGQVTPVIETRDAFYIALVEAKTAGTVQTFDDEAVQTQIAERLKTRDFNALLQQVHQNLIADAVVRTDREMINIAVEMAMQNYPRWAGK